MESNPEREDLIKLGVNNSPYYKHLGMKLVDYDEDGSVMEMPVTPEHINVWGSMHGGALSGLVDSSCGTAIGPALAPGENVVTLDLRVQFLKPVKDGVLTARGRIVHRGGRHVITESEVKNQDGELVARGGGIHILIIKNPKQRNG